ncbi:MAG: alpha/beta hydrolase [Planctomycetota bacterium]
MIDLKPPSKPSTGTTGMRSLDVEIERARERGQRSGTSTLVAVAGLTMAVVVIVINVTGVFAPAPPPVEPATNTRTNRPAADAPAPPPSTIPPLPFALREPDAPDAMWNGHDLSKTPPDKLTETIRDAMAARDAPVAAQLQYWAIHNGQVGGMLNMAELMSALGDADATLWWITQCAIKEGFAPDWLEDSYPVLRKDTRLPALRTWLTTCQAYWRAHPVLTTPIVVPEGYDGSRKIPTVFWLHGHGSDPNLVGPMVTNLANALDIAFVGISGTDTIGPIRFGWSRDCARNWQRVQQGLTEALATHKLKPTRLILFGFSAGAQTALDLLVRHPDAVGGAIALSPGADGGAQYADLPTTPDLARCFAVIGVGSEEHPGNKALAKLGVDTLTGWGAQVVAPVFAGGRHSLPAGFMELFPTWVREIESHAKLRE